MGFLHKSTRPLRPASFLGKTPPLREPDPLSPIVPFQEVTPDYTDALPIPCYGKRTTLSGHSGRLAQFSADTSSEIPRRRLPEPRPPGGFRIQTAQQPRMPSAYTCRWNSASPAHRGTD